MLNPTHTRVIRPLIDGTIIICIVADIAETLADVYGHYHSGSK
jgi:hypothetical protein